MYRPQAPVPSAPAQAITRRRLVLTAGPALTTLLMAGQFASPGRAADRMLVGTVDRLVGEASVVVGRTTRPLEREAKLFVGDRVITSAEGRLEIACTDGSTIIVAAKTTVTLSEFTTNADGSGKTAVLDMVEGLVRVSLSRLGVWQRFEVATPTAIAAARSTEWIVVAEPAHSAVFVVHGRVEVVDRQLLGGVILDPGDGTDVRAGAPPTVAKRWGQKRVDDVLSRTRLP
jgi:hypothetical protein